MRGDLPMQNTFRLRSHPTKELGQMLVVGHLVVAECIT
jgi:hypothetical protein